MREGNGTLRVAAIADLHTHAPGSSPHTGAEASAHRAIFSEISDAADVLVICGDLTNLGLPEEAEVLASELSALRIPAVAVLGNHDHQHEQATEVKRIIARAGVTFLEEETYQFNGVGFAGVKGFGGGFGSRMLSSFGEPAIKQFVSEAVNESLALEHSLASLTTDRIVVALHYSPVPETLSGEPEEIYPFMGCSRLAETIDRFNVAAVFHGHAHHGALQGATGKGIPVYNCSIEARRRAEQEKPYIVIEV